MYKRQLHGGPTGFHTRIWDAEQETPQSLKLHYLSADGEEGFPGNLDIHVTSVSYTHLDVYKRQLLPAQKMIFLTHLFLLAVPVGKYY